MPDERWWRRGLVIGTGVVLALALLVVTAVAAGLTWTDPVTVSSVGREGNRRYHPVQRPSRLGYVFGWCGMDVV